jgi:hypothetical protein
LIDFQGNYEEYLASQQDAAGIANIR